MTQDYVEWVHDSQWNEKLAMAIFGGYFGY